MFLANRLLQNSNINDQIKSHKEDIEFLKNLFSHKTINEVSNSITILDQGNKKLFDHSRKFPIYEDNILLYTAKSSLYNIVKNIINLDHLDSYCDVGCGHGQYPKAAMELQCKKSVGIDIIKNNSWNRYLEGETNLHYILADLSTTRINQKFQLITSFSAFEHFIDPVAMLNSMSELVEDNGYLYIYFNPIWNSTDGHHQYRHIQFPYYHLIFSEKVTNEYIELNKFECPSLYFNKWSALDFMYLFNTFNKLKLIKFNTIFDIKHYWFVNTFPEFFSNYSLEEVLIAGFALLFRKL